MKKTILAVLIAGVALSTGAQGWISIDNVPNSNLSPAATSGGLFWIETSSGPVLMSQDFNLAAFGGTDLNDLALLATFLLSDGSAVGATTQLGSGFFLPQRSAVYQVPGTVRYPLSVFVQLQAWTGDYSSYAAALAGGAATAESPVFSTPAAGGPDSARSLTGMPAMILTVPEPSALALILLGGSCLWVFGWRLSLPHAMGHGGRPDQPESLSRLTHCHEGMSHWMRSGDKLLPPRFPQLDVALAPRARGPFFSGHPTRKLL